MTFRLDPGVSLNWWQRGLFVGFALFLLSGFFLACQMTPDPRGFGTHQQLGFPPCSFAMVFGIPCPSCGGTTCFAHFVRGQWSQAIAANAGCFALAIGSALLAPWCLLCGFTGRTTGVNRPLQGLFCFLVTVSLLAGTQWAWRLANL